MAQDRRAEFKRALSDPDNPWFAVAREQLEKEEARLRSIEAELKTTRVQPAEELIPPLSVGLVLLAGVVAAACWLILRHWRRRKVELAGWSKPYWIGAAALYAAHQIREILSSVVATDKTWYAWSSFCVSPAGWWSIWVVSLGAALIFGRPVALLYCLGSSQHRPGLDLGSPEGSWGVSWYVLFLQTWTLASLTSTLWFTALWVRAAIWTGRLSPIYLLSSLTVIGTAAVISTRLILRAVELRLEFQRAAAEARADGVDPSLIPGDPTVPFLGQHWWSLPGTVLGMLGSLWIAVEWSGILELIR